MDIEYVIAAKAAADGQLNNAIVEIDRLKEENEKLVNELEVMYQKVISTEKDRDQMRDIMTKNITDSNARIQGYLQEITELKAYINGNNY